MVEWWAWVVVVIGINIIVIGRFLAWRKFKRTEYEEGEGGDQDQACVLNGVQPASQS